MRFNERLVPGDIVKVVRQFYLSEFVSENDGFGKTYDCEQESIMTFIRSYVFRDRPAGYKQTCMIFLSSDNLVLEGYEHEIIRNIRNLS